MPPVLVAVVGAAAATFIGTGGAIVAFGTTFSLFSSFLIRAALGIALNALSPKPKGPSGSGSGGYTVTQRGSALDHQIIYGKARVGGAIVFDGSTGDANRFLHRVVVFTGHEIESFDEIYINDEVATIDGSNNVTSPARYNGKMTIEKKLGTADQTASAALVSDVDGWTTDHRLRGCSYLYIRFAFDADAYPNGVPEVTAVIKGKKVFDTRDSTTAWSDNPALCLRDYITSGYGLVEETANIDDTLVSAAATICDEVDTLNSSTRYTCNGAFTTANTPFESINDILTSMGGLLWYAQGKWRMKPAYWTTPVLDLDENDFRSTVDIQTRFSRRDNFNTIAGKFRGEETNWQFTDYPPITNSAFLSADGGLESVLDLALPFTDTSVEARRISRIALERNRQQLTISAKFGLRAFAVQVGDNVRVSNTQFGWTNKEFEVVSWTFGVASDLTLEVEMTLRETAESIFDEVDDGIVYERDNTTLLSPFEVPAIGFSLSTNLVIIREKLTNYLYIDVNAASSVIDYVDVEYKLSSATDYTNIGSGPPGRFVATDIEDGIYDVRIRGINTFGVKGLWVQQPNFTVDGLAQPPQDVENFSAEVNGPVINLSWDVVPDLDLSHYKIRFSPNVSTASWSNSYTYVNKVPRPATSVSVPAKSGKYLIRSYDKSGIPSVNATEVIVLPADLESFVTTLTLSEDPNFSGVKDGCVVVDEALRKASALNFDSLTGNVDSFVGQWDSLGITYSGTTANYLFSTYIDSGSVGRRRVTVDASPVRFNSSVGLFDDLSGNILTLTGLWDNLTGTDFADFDDTNIETLVSMTDDDPAGTPSWSDYRPIRVSDLSGRAFRFRLNFTSDVGEVTSSILELDAKVEYN